MYRQRRYRIYIVLAIFTVAIIYQFTSITRWNNVKTEIAQGLDQAGQMKPLQATPIGYTKTDASSTPAPTTTYNSLIPTKTPEPDIGDFGKFGLSGQGRLEVPPQLPDKPAIHWEMLPEHFPVPPAAMIILPTERPRPIPKIQYHFKDESSMAKSERKKKQDEIRDAFKHAWSGYKTHAWLQDELSPVSGGSRNPFCEWAATLVDSLDTLWIMGLEEEFKEAAKAVGTIDFTKTPRKDIPVFETTIRYLGGLIAAYDLSGSQYKILLEKAEELAEVLYGAFDTPNRMPITYYYWRPTFAANPHRAGTRVVLAELGSLAMEFTRLAQLTKRDRYYDAVARITEELDNYQGSTKIPGLWPNAVDASGCKKPEIKRVGIAAEKNQAPLRDGEDQSSSSISSTTSSTAAEESPTATDASSAELGKLGTTVEDKSSIIDSSNAKDNDKTDSPFLRKRQIDTNELGSANRLKQPEHMIDTNSAPQKVDCEAQGLASPPSAFFESFTLGAQADSTYEYLPKMHMLLGGLVPQYQTMYEKAIEAANEYLLFRPMVPDGHDILAMGSVVAQNTPTGNIIRTLHPEQAHLTCFVGGMYAIGSKIFERKADLDLAAKLTEGCVWAYEATSTGIMAERMTLIPCDSMKSCPWNQTRWYAELDPWRESREAQQEYQRTVEAVLKAHGAEDMLASSTTSSYAAPTTSSSETTAEEGEIPSKKVEATVKEDEIASKEVEATVKEDEAATKRVESTVKEDDSERVKDVESKGTKEKRQLGDSNNDHKIPEITKTKNEDSDKDSPIDRKAPEVTKTKNLDVDKDSPIGEMKSQSQFPTHEKFVESRIKDEHIPEGIPIFGDKTYKLRPEAIESVFIMYRITGDEKWRDKGWKMFQAIQKHCTSQYGHSAIGDVTDPETFQKDEMESFWLAETLKYFYLLFSPPDTISLDDYVLNTEAHPFKRPR